jgi:mRNA interferase MazF
MAHREPLRGEIWTVDLNPTIGREQRGMRPALVVSTNQFNRGPAELLVVLPVTSKKKGIPLHVEIANPEGGVKTTSYAMAEAVQSISKLRLGRRCGSVSRRTMELVADRLRILLEL